MNTQKEEMDAQIKKELTKECTNEKVQKQTHKRAMLKIKATEKKDLKDSKGQNGTPGGKSQDTKGFPRTKDSC